MNAARWSAISSERLEREVDAAVLAASLDSRAETDAGTRPTTFKYLGVTSHEGL